MDDFYVLSKPTVKKVKEILTWAHKNGLKTDIDQLDCSVSYRRARSDKSFSWVMRHVDRKAAGFFRVVFRHQVNPYLILSESSERVDLVEVFIRSIDVDSVEYFFFIYLEPAKLYHLRKMYDLERLT